MGLSTERISRRQRTLMKKVLTIICATAAVASTAQERAAHKQAVKTCQAQHKALTKAEFKALYGKNGVAHCVKKETAENTAEAKTAQKTAHTNATTQCRTERDQDATAFQNTYGTGPQKKNAFGKCVSQHARANEQELAAQDAQEDQNQVEAARTCHDERD